MRKYLSGVVILINILPAFAGNIRCSSELAGYKVVKNSVYPFTVDKEKACFFAFYTTNPEPMTDFRGNGNLGDALWYGYYKISNSSKIFQFPKPWGTDWSSVCSLDAVSFYPMHGDKKNDVTFIGSNDVTIIGSCDKNSINYTVAFVFTWQGDKYVLDEDAYSDLYGFISLTIADVRKYIKSPESYYKILEERYN